MSFRFSPGNVASKPAFDSASRSFAFSNPDGTSTVAVFAFVSTETFVTPATEASAFFTGGAHEAQSMPMTLKVSVSANAGAATKMPRSRSRFMRRLTQVAAEAIHHAKVRRRIRRVRERRDARRSTRFAISPSRTNRAVPLAVLAERPDFE